MPRFFINSDEMDARGGRITITGEDARHIAKALRMERGDALELSDCSGADYGGIIENVAEDAVTVRIISSKPSLTESPLDVILFQGLPKAGKMEYIIQKCVELGIRRIVPVISDRTVVRINGGPAADSKTARWRRIAAESAKQCGRGLIPPVDEPVSFDKALEIAESCSLKIMPYEEEKERGLRGLLRAYSGSGGRIAVFIGPEGGFSREEVVMAEKAGFETVTLGPRILRTETAGAVVAAIIMYELGDMGR